MFFSKALIGLSLAFLAGSGGKEGHPSGWDKYVRVTAFETYTYAQMATNAYLTPQCVLGTAPNSCEADYKKKAKFYLGSKIVALEAQDNDDIGFAYAVFARREAGRTREIIIAYRGTENFADWWHGNLLFTQNHRGLELYRKWKKKAEAMGDNVKVSVTGHSLGGAIATYVSLVEKGANCYVFNASPRFRREATPVPDNHRVSVVEYGEVNKALRVFGRSPTQTYLSIGCSRGNAIKQHSMRALAECLTAAAAWEHPQARSSLVRNGIELPEGLN
jgi:hypothetical protein